jgi:DNA-binding MltR family transcriptional regulator
LEQAIKQNLKEDENNSEDTDEIIMDDIDEIEKELSNDAYNEFRAFKDEESELDLEALIDDEDPV